MAYSGGRGGDSSKKSTYFAVDEAEKVAAHMGNKSYYWYNTVYDNRYLDLIRRSWYMYHGFFYDESHMIGYGGESGELVNLAVNHYRNIAQHMLTMTTSTRPSFQPKSTNTDYDSQVQTTLAHGLLDYYMKEKRLEKYLKKAVEYAIVLSAGYIKMEWNATSGEIYDYVEPEMEVDEETGEERPVIDPVTGKPSEGYPVYEGDIEFTNLSPFDVVFDSTKEDVKQNDWVLIRTFKNRFDLAAKYPELADKILDLPTKDELGAYRLTFNPLDQTDDVPVYEFYHKRTEAVPNGRFITYLSDDVVLTDTAMPYRDLPIYRISPSDVLGAPYGYTSMFDLLPLQEGVNSLYSTIMTNQNAFGVQNILNPRGNDVRLNHVGSGMNFIEYNAEFGRPEALNLTQTPGEIFNFLQMLEQAMETVSGVNSVVRGNPEASLKSGNALALVQSQSLQFISGLQQSYIMLIEDVGTGLINVLKDFAKVPRVAEIVGVSNRTKMKTFTGDNLNSISRVVVDVGNALSQTTAGRTQMADNLLQMGLITNPQDYFSVLNTGNLEALTEGQVNQNLLIRAENEALMDGQTDVIATAVDQHRAHITKHMNVLADPDLRLDRDLTARVLAHIQEHIDLLRTTDPNLLSMIGEQPLAPVGGTPVNPQNAGSTPAGNMDQTLQNPQAQSTDPMLSAGVQQPQPAAAEGQPNTPEDVFVKNLG